MKVKELIEKLKGYEDFDLEAVHVNEIQKDKFMNITTFNISDVADIGYSSKVVVLELDGE